MNSNVPEAIVKDMCFVSLYPRFLPLHVASRLARPRKGSYYSDRVAPMGSSNTQARKSRHLLSYDNQYSRWKFSPLACQCLWVHQPVLRRPGEQLQ